MKHIQKQRETPTPPSSRVEIIKVTNTHNEDRKFHNAIDQATQMYHGRQMGHANFVFKKAKKTACSGTNADTHLQWCYQ